MGENAVQNGSLQIPLFVFQLRFDICIIEGTTAEYVFIMYGERFPLVDAWRADQVLYGNYTLDIYSDDVGLCEVHRETPIQQLSKYNSTGYIYPTVHVTKCSISLCM